MPKKATFLKQKTKTKLTRQAKPTSAGAVAESPAVQINAMPEMEEVASQIGNFIEYWGFKNVHGRIWALLFLAREPLDSRDLTERLGISKALVSMSIADLLEYDVIQKAGTGERGTWIYQANPDVIGVVTNVLRKRERRMLGRIAAATQTLVNLLERQNQESATQELLSRSQKNRADQAALAALSERRIYALNDMVKTAEKSLEGMLSMSEVDFRLFCPFSEIPQ